MRAWLFVMLVGCAADADVATDAGAFELDAVDARTDLPDDGFGFSCTSRWQPDHLITKCTSSEGLTGFCDVGICRRRCDGIANADHIRSCPQGQTPIPIPENECVCMPNRCVPFVPPGELRGGETNCVSGDRL